ncbi:MAG: class II glutamine amidotransferase [Myxococcales bacterium]|nr:class II glutamine amidotransferase [Myxococcales bacterium]
MCRALLYLGQPVLLDHLLFQPDSALVKQTFNPRKLHMLNLAGFGMMAWSGDGHRPEVPWHYAATELPVFDRNLKAMAEKVRAHCLLAHVRGVAYSTKAIVSRQNTHPFSFPGHRLVLAHNGDLHRFDEMKSSVFEHVSPALRSQVQGTTDSEWIHALVLSQIEDPDAPLSAEAIKRAVEKALRILRDVRRAHGISTSSSVNLFLTDGECLFAVRFCFDFGRYSLKGPEKVQESNLNYLSLWYTAGREFGYHEDEWKMIGGSDTADSLMVASEPLTVDTTTWLEVPEYAMLFADTRGARPVIDIAWLDV